ncbi:hypothetical protein LMG22931_05678 [Paraburkholderia nemoris]|nr:hypothetical protein LMG22931_05678 [Paraburkholderia nemoris]
MSGIGLCPSHTSFSAPPIRMRRGIDPTSHACRQACNSRMPQMQRTAYPQKTPLIAILNGAAVARKAHEPGPFPGTSITRSALQ